MPFDEEGNYTPDDGGYGTVDDGEMYTPGDTVTPETPDQYDPYAAANADNPYAAGTTSQSDAADQQVLSQYLEDAKRSGLGGSLLDKLSNAWNTGSKWVKDNKELTAMLTNGVGSAMRQKNDRELMALRNQYQIDQENRVKDYQRELWQRKNDSITGMAPVSLGIIGKAMLDPHLEYLQSRKK